METENLSMKFLEKSKPYFAMTLLQFGYAGMNIIAKVSLDKGMSHYVLVVYRHAIATAAIAPFAFIFEREGQPKITFPVFMQIFILALLGPVIDQNFYYAGLKLTSPTYACAMSNMLPAMTFVMATLCGMEKINIKKVRCRAKAVGTSLTVIGAMLMTLYKGPVLEMLGTKHSNLHYNETYATTTAGGSSNKAWFLGSVFNETYASATTTTGGSSNKAWFLGSVFLMVSSLAWASLFILQTKAIETYKNHQLSLTSIICFIGTLQATVVTFVVEHHHLSIWRIGWDMNLLAAAYAGIVNSSISYYVQGLVIKEKGPVFATAFSPLMMVFVAIMAFFILSEQIYLGGVIGAILIATGLYSVLWGKHKDEIHSKIANDIPFAMKVTQMTGNAGLEIDTADHFIEVQSG